jgi:hypothetical protein
MDFSHRKQKSKLEEFWQQFAIFIEEQPFSRQLQHKMSRFATPTSLGQFFFG